MDKRSEAIDKKFNELIESILDYESDTFSASSSKITEQEAYTIAERFILEDITKRIDTDTVDGVMLSEELENIRD